MAEKKKLTMYQRIESALTGNWNRGTDVHRNTYGISDKRVFRTTSKEEYDTKKLELAQSKFLAKQWVKTNRNLDIVESFKGKNNLMLMYTDADFMDSSPEISSALDTIAEECCLPNQEGFVINVSSESSRIKKILDDLLQNRLDINITAPMVIRSMCKYGNQFMLLDVSKEEGIKSWRQLPVGEIERLENGVDPMNMGAVFSSTNEEEMATKFRWVGVSQAGIQEFRNWQVAHFRLITNSMYLPYGVSYLNPARRHFRMLCLMEDMMLIYRLERSIDRRVFKIFVGAMDDADIPAYMDEIANNFKRTPIVDPLTGQLDLRKNILTQADDFFIPVRDMGASSPIETLSGSSNNPTLEDIKYVQNKVLTALCVPKPFISFEDLGNGMNGNLALLDVRFARKINRIQQSFLLEMNKICILHLYLLGFQDELSNFRLTMTNPSTQMEMSNVENLGKKIGLIRDSVADPGNGIPILSLKKALELTLGFSDKEYKENLEEIRFESAVKAELAKTEAIIQRTGIFDKVDRIYGEPGATYQGSSASGGEDGGGGAPGGGGGSFGGGVDIGGGGMDFGSPDMGGGAPMDGVGGVGEGAPSGDISGTEGGEPMA